MDNFFRSKIFRVVILGTTGLIVVVFSFAIFAGVEKSDRGVLGQITKVDSFNELGQNPTLTVMGINNIEKKVIIDDNTRIVSQKENVELSSLEIDDDVIVIGHPDNDGMIKAEFIRKTPRKEKNNK